MVRHSLDCFRTLCACVCWWCNILYFFCLLHSSLFSRIFLYFVLFSIRSFTRCNCSEFPFWFSSFVVVVVLKGTLVFCCCYLVFSSVKLLWFLCLVLVKILAGRNIHFSCTCGYSLYKNSKNIIHPFNLLVRLFCFVYTFYSVWLAIW